MACLTALPVRLTYPRLSRPSSCYRPAARISGNLLGTHSGCLLYKRRVEAHAEAGTAGAADHPLLAAQRRGRAFHRQVGIALELHERPDVRRERSEMDHV